MAANRRALLGVLVVVGLFVSGASVVASDPGLDSTLRPAFPPSFDSVIQVSPNPTTAVAPPGDAVRVAPLASWGGDRANTLAFSPDGQLLAVGASLGIYFYEAPTLAEIRFLQTDTWVRSVAFSPDGQMLASGSYDEIVRLWQVAEGTLQRTLEGHTGWVRSVAFSPDGQTLASASDDNTVRLWRVSDGGLLRTLTEHTDGVRAVAFSPDGALLATGGYDNTVRLWSVSEGALLRTLQGHTGWVRCLAFSPDGKLLASGGFDATARLWRVADGALLHTLEGHTASVLGLAFSPDGRTLASASVDTTIRLWQVPDGIPMPTLKGHKGFVFSVAFSPDGLTLASGGVDNAVYLWSSWDQAQSPDTKEATGNSGQAASSTCKECHHPIGDQPARVIETECTACHLNGPLGLNWCPSFYRAPGPTTMSVNPAGISGQSGVPHGNRNFGVEISSPGNGEYLYSRGDIVAAVPVRGKVYSADSNLAGVQIQLQIQSQGKQTTILTTTPRTDGSFSFYVNVSETEHELDLVLNTRTQAPNESSCLRCHDKYYVADTRLSPGQYRLITTATMLDGSQAFDERWVIVEHGQLISVPVKVELAETHQAVPNLPLSASTRLYEWRGRTFTGATDNRGIAHLQVEILSAAPTHYTFQVPPTVVEGVLYSSTEPVEVTLLPGATSIPPVTLVVQVQQGDIRGRLSGTTITSLAPISVWAIHLPEGKRYQTETSPEGTFEFDAMPIDQYLIVAEAEALAAQGLSSTAQSLDLAQSPVAEVVLPLATLEGFALQGVVRDAEGVPLPFAWVTSEPAGLERAVQVSSGAWSLLGLPTVPRTLVVMAPGFYSQALAVSSSASDAPLEFNLTRRPETQSIPWGQGKLILPPETRATVSSQEITLESGWLWGSGDGGQLLVIHTAGTIITLRGGGFALENAPGQTAWLYVFEGEAEVRDRSAAERNAIVPANMMLALLETGRLTPVPLEPVVVDALRSGQRSPLSPVWEPSVSAQWRDRLALMGINAAQIITFVTYLLALLSLFGMPLLGILWWVKRRNRIAKGHR